MTGEGRIYDDLSLHIRFLEFGIIISISVAGETAKPRADGTTS